MASKQPKLGARNLAYLALCQIEKDGAYANIALKQVLNQYHPQPRRDVWLRNWSMALPECAWLWIIS